MLSGLSGWILALRRGHHLPFSARIHCPDTELRLSSAQEVVAGVAGAAPVVPGALPCNAPAPGISLASHVLSPVNVCGSPDSLTTKNVYGGVGLTGHWLEGGAQRA